MPDAWPVAITDDDGNRIRVDLDGFEPGKVYIRTSELGVSLDAARQEELAQALVAASHETARRVPSAHAMHCQCTAARQARLEMGASDG